MANVQKHIQYLKMNMWEVMPYEYQSFVIQHTCHALWSSQSQQRNPDTYIFTVILSAALMFTCILAYKWVCFVICNKLLYFSLSQYVADIQTLMEQDFWKRVNEHIGHYYLPIHLWQRFSNFFEVGTTFISQNSSADRLTLVPFESKCIIFLAYFNSSILIF
jgi:hypothetical protein